jgi:hypothetical protein
MGQTGLDRGQLLANQDDGLAAQLVNSVGGILHELPVLAVQLAVVELGLGCYVLGSHGSQLHLRVGDQARPDFRPEPGRADFSLCFPIGFSPLRLPAEGSTELTV